MMRAEDVLQASVRAYLDAALPAGSSWWTATANGAFLGGDARRRAIQGARMKRTGVKPGTPDLIICHDGRFLSIELKAGKGRQSDAQEAVEEQIQQAGGGYALCRSVEAVEDALSVWNVPLRVSTRRAA